MDVTVRQASALNAESAAAVYVASVPPLDSSCGSSAARARSPAGETAAFHWMGAAAWWVGP